MFPSPLGESGMSIKIIIFIDFQKSVSFRPLSGNQVCLFSIDLNDNRIQADCFRPLSGNQVCL